MDELDYLFLDPASEANPEALEAILNADKIIINPGDFYSSIIPNILVDGISRALLRSKAKKIFVCNLMNKKNHTSGFSADDYINILHKYAGGKIVDYAIYNNEKPDEELLSKYSEEGDSFVLLGGLENDNGIILIKEKLLGKTPYKQQAGDAIKRTLIRHDSLKLAKIICEL
jgi:uncharacterized cofD-like protein